MSYLEYRKQMNYDVVLGCFQQPALNTNALIFY